MPLGCNKEAQSTHQKPSKASAMVEADGGLCRAISVATQDRGAGAHSVQAAVEGARAVLLCGAVWLREDAANEAMGTGKEHHQRKVDDWVCLRQRGGGAGGRRNQLPR